MWRRLSHIALTASIAGAMVLVPASQASAASSAGLPDCPDNSLCGWSGSFFTGKVMTFGWSPPCTNAPIPLRSVANTHQGTIGIPIVMAVYSGPNCTGKYLGSVARGQSLPNLPVPGLSVSVAV